MKGVGGEVFAQQDSIVVNEYSVGLDYQTISINNYSTMSRKYQPAIIQVSTQSLSARMQSSLFEKLWKKRRKLNVADFLASEFNMGNKYLAQQTLNAYLAYRFEYGASLLWRASANHQFGLHVIVLKFTHTGIMGNVSGSAVVLRYKYKQILFESALESQTQLFFGWAAGMDKNKNIALQASGSIKYQHKGNMYGLRASFFPLTNIPFQADYVRTINNVSIRVFIGLCF
ncbi:MAG TPA: hypothetical protein VF411_12365 [Bacteroidia bacterium]